MEFKQLGGIEFGGLEDLSLADVHILEGVDAAGSLLNLTTDGFRQEFLDELLQIAGGSLTGHDLEHLLSDLANLTRLGVCGFADLRWAAFCEADSEKAEEVAVGGLDINMSFNEGLPFADKGAQFVGGEIHPVEVGQAVLALDVVNTQFDFAEGLLLLFVEIGEGKFDDTTLQ